MESESRKSAQWSDYRKELNAFIRLPESKMVINADEEWDLRSKEKSEGRAAFKLQNGQAVKEFITVWEMFDHRYELNQCIVKLTEKAIEIRERVCFSSVVTATPTARELGEHLVHGLRMRMPEQDIALHHFGDSPKAHLSYDGTPGFRDEQVLVLTDVINSGSLVSTMTDLIEKGDGKVVAVLSVVITSPEWIDFQNLHGKPYEMKVGRQTLCFHNLADFAIHPLQSGNYDESKVIPIDYSSVLPERRNVSTTHYPPAYDVRTMFAHLEDAEAVDFGFYELSDARLTSAFILPRLLERYRDEIWHHIRNPILKAATRIRANQSSSDLLLVTTYNRKDLLFKDFVQDCLLADGCKTETAITLKRGVTDTPHLNLTLGAGGRDVKGKEVVVVLATLSTQEKLRNIVSLLVDAEVKNVIVVCLLNRLGPFTTNFIRAVERLTRRMRINNPGVAEPTLTDFNFSMVYNLLDLRGKDLRNISNELANLLSTFRNQTKVSAFVRLCDRIQGYFESRSYIERAYVKSAYKVLPSPYRLPDKNGSPPVEVRTQEAKIALITYNLVLNRDFRPIIEELSSTLDRRIFIHLYGLILSDIHYLRFTGTLRVLKDELLARLSSLREQRFELERRKVSKLTTDEMEAIRETINAEVYLIFGIGIIAHYDSRQSLTGLENDVLALLFCSKSPEQWLEEYRVCLQEYFSDERIFFVVAFLLHGLYPDFYRSSVAMGMKQQLDAEVERYKKAFKAKLKDLPGEAKTRTRLIMNNFDLMLHETGKYDHQEKHQIVRYLHRMVLRPKEGHNPIFTTLRELISAMTLLFEQYQASQKTYPINADLPLTKSEEETFLTKLDEALSGTSSLHTIASTVRQLFFFTPTVQTQQERYTNSIAQPGFARDIDLIIRKLNDLRSHRTFSQTDLAKIRELDTQLRSDFFDRDSHLRLVLNSYIVNLEDLVKTLLLEMNAQLNMQDFNDLLLPAYREIEDSSDPENSKWPVLGEHHLIRELLKNLFDNLKHSFPADKRLTLPNDAFRLEIQATRYSPRPEKGKKSGVSLLQRVKAEPPRIEDFTDPEHTIGDQLLRIQELGGDWEFLHDENGKEFVFAVNLLTRFGYTTQAPSRELVEKERQLDDEV